MEDVITQKVIGAAMKVHSALGPGLLESAYEVCLAYEISELGFMLERQKPLPVIYEKVRLDCGYRLDLVVEKSVVIEVKSVECILPIHCAQLLSYLRLSGMHLGLLLNFNVPRLKDGIKRIANNFVESPRPLRTLR